MADESTLYVSTENGLFSGRLNGAVRDVQPVGLQGQGRVWPIVADHRLPNRRYAVTSRGGVFRSDDGGKTWAEKNNGIIFKQCWCIAQHPETGELYVGTGPAAVFKSIDYGESWTFSEQMHTMPETKEWTFPGPPYIAHVKGLGLSRNDPRRIFGAIEEGYIIRSVDGGETWMTIKNGAEFDSHTVTVMPDNADVIVTTSGKGCFRSDDGGNHFALANDGLSRKYMSQLVVDSAKPNVLFTAASAGPPLTWRGPQGANAALFRSEDQGKHWAQLSGGGLPEMILPSPRAVTNDPRAAGSALAGMSDGSVWMTRDYGESFEQIVTGLPSIFGLSVVHD
jgi:photosystem II stability/assembly factor-like uncharacterized protein